MLALVLTIPLGSLLGGVVAIATFAGAVGVISRLRPVRWLWRHLVYDPFTEWFRREVGDIVDAKLDARPILNGGGEATIEKVHAIAEKLEVD